LTSFCAVFLKDPPAIVFLRLSTSRMATRHRRHGAGGHTAAPVAGRVVSRIAPLLRAGQKRTDTIGRGTRRSNIWGHSRGHGGNG
jgi:hypothetical protein